MHELVRLDCTAQLLACEEAKIEFRVPHNCRMWALLTFSPYPLLIRRRTASGRVMVMHSQQPHPSCVASLKVDTFTSECTAAAAVRIASNVLADSQTPA